jgi:malto-oligosyltrehalose trehalohydrolase
MTRQFSAQPQFGANLKPHGTTNFRIYAPDLDVLSLELDGRSIAMRRGADGIFEATEPAPAGTRYGFRVRPDLIVPDPASRAQPEGVHGPSMVIDPLSYEWRNGGWRGRPWHEAVILELHAGLLGGYAGIRQRLRQYAAMGITGIELMPVAQFPGERNWGYDGVLPYAPQWSYGWPDELKGLIDEAHGLGLMVLLDVVYNHFGPDGNYLPVYASTLFRGDRTTPWGPALDFQNAHLSRYFIDNAIYWLNEYRFDGLRLDAVHAIGDHAWLKKLATEVRAACSVDRHIWLVLENDENATELLAPGLFNAQWNDDGHHVIHRLLSGEVDGYYSDYREQPAAKLATVLSEGFLFQGQASDYRNGAARGTSSKHLPPTAFVLFIQNHDQIGNRAFGDRLTSLASADAMQAALTLLLLAPQVPLLFMGEEVGATAPFQFFTDHEGELAAAVREGRRKEFAGFARFDDETKRSEIPDPNEAATFERSRPYRDDPDEERWRSFVSRLLRIRGQHIAPRLHTCLTLGAQALGDGAVEAGWLLDGGLELTLLCNLGPSEAHITYPPYSPFFVSRPDLSHEFEHDRLPAFTTIAYLREPAQPDRCASTS